MHSLLAFLYLGFLPRFGIIDQPFNSGQRKENKGITDTIVGSRIITNEIAGAAY